MNKLDQKNSKKSLPHKEEFYPFEGIYFNAGVQHPASKGCVEAANKYLNYKGFHENSNYDPLMARQNVLELYAKLINADVNEIAFVQSTTVGENLLLQALNIINTGGQVITDDLHYFGSYQIYGELKKQGVDVVTLRSKNGSIDLEQYEKAITEKTTLVAVSSVSTFNGFQHDLKELCKLAHSKGALVYADSIHHIGATPFDVRDSNVDFCSAGSFKWLMADQGLGFLYVKKDVLSKLKRPWYGKRQIRSLTTHVFPGDVITSDENVYEYELENTTEGYFSIWSEPRIVVAQLEYSLKYILDIGVDRITEYRQPFLKHLQEELPKLGYKALTPKGTITPLLAYEFKDAAKILSPILKEHNILASLYKGHFRIALSVYNDMADVERFIDVLKIVSQDIE